MVVYMYVRVYDYDRAWHMIHMIHEYTPPCLGLKTTSSRVRDVSCFFFINTPCVDSSYTRLYTAMHDMSIPPPAWGSKPQQANP